MRLRELERADGWVEVLAPEGWTSARVEAWLDWAARVPNDRPPQEQGLKPVSSTLADALNCGPAAWAERLAAWGWAMGLFDRIQDAATFQDELVATVLLGLAAPGSRPESGRRSRIDPLSQTAPTAPPAEPTATQPSLDAVRILPPWNSESPPPNSSSVSSWQCSAC